MDENSIQSSNINSQWLQNIFENLKKIEEFERLAREGCTSILDYLQYPQDIRRVIIADIQYKNLKLIINEMKLVIPDLSPVIAQDKVKELRNKLSDLSKFTNDRRLFVVENYSEVKKVVTDSYMTKNFELVLEGLSLLRQEIIFLIQHILYVAVKPTNTW